MWMRPLIELDSMRLAVFTVSPNRQYLSRHSRRQPRAPHRCRQRTPSGGGGTEHRAPSNEQPSNAHRASSIDLGLRVPTTLATTGPEWNPTRMLTKPLLGSSRSIAVCLAAATTSSEKRAIRTAWSGCSSTWKHSKQQHPAQSGCP
eukprot:2225437-Rhodomonas_salina.4